MLQNINNKDFTLIALLTWGHRRYEQTHFQILYVQVTVHRDNLRINNQQDASSIQNFFLSRNPTCFGHLLFPSSGIISRTRGNWYVSCRLWPLQRPPNLHETYQLPRVQLITPDDGNRRCPKHVGFHDKIKILDTWCILLVIYTKHFQTFTYENGYDLGLGVGRGNGSFRCLLLITDIS
jgi:hypothetical protein